MARDRQSVVGLASGCGGGKKRICCLEEPDTRRYLEFFNER
eukprot:CAMPEP_0171981828 /NCGR_PEP_ID=MMETSP0993-20121228/268193_1 /TAXON_ID=483369 /ORGANISM="non described non described, Strain CCMP2098" /LENGTH=40 /DNA_ID= /DNA_START= /DNA_END= /DNA_ORIENTATION=